MINYPNRYFCSTQWLVTTPEGCSWFPKSLKSTTLKGTAKLKEDCDVIMDQIRSINNQRLLKKNGNLEQGTIDLIKENLLIIPKV